MNETVSIIIPTLNEARDLGDLLESIKNQTYKKIEVIVVDGGSTDGTGEIAKKYTKNIYILPKAGVTVSRNYGAKKSKGKILQFMDADAVLRDKNYIRKLVAAYDKYDVDIVVNRTDAYPPKNVMGRAQQAYRKNTWEAHQKKIVFDAGLPQIAFSCYRRSAFQKLRGYNEKLIGNDEIDLSRRAKEAGMRTVFVPDIVIYHKDPYTFGQIRRQAHWYARVLKKHETTEKKAKTLVYLAVYPFVYIMLALTAMAGAWNLFALFNLIFLIPMLYLFLISKDIAASIFMIYILNPARAVWFLKYYVGEK